MAKVGTKPTRQKLAHFLLLSTYLGTAPGGIRGFSPICSTRHCVEQMLENARKRSERGEQAKQRIVAENDTITHDAPFRRKSEVHIE